MLCYERIGLSEWANKREQFDAVERDVQNCDFTHSTWLIVMSRYFRSISYQMNDTICEYLCIHTLRILDQKANKKKKRRRKSPRFYTLLSRNHDWHLAHSLIFIFFMLNKSPDWKMLLHYFFFLAFLFFFILHFRHAMHLHSLLFVVPLVGWIPNQFHCTYEF